MLSSIRSHLSYANVAATMALVFAMGGSAVAANHYLVTSTKQIKPSVLKSLKGNAGHTGATGPQGKEGLQGKEGSAGKEGARGPSDVWQAGDGESASSTAPLSVSVPAGSYLVQAATTASGGTGDSACHLVGGSQGDNAYVQNGPSATQVTVTNIETTVLSSPGKIELNCGGAAEHFWYAKLTAIQVGTIH